MRNLGTYLTMMGVISGLVLWPVPVTWAQPIEVDRAIATEVTAEVERLVEATALHDPELARIIDGEGVTCIRDIQDNGVLDNPEFTKAVEAVVATKEAQETAAVTVATEQVVGELAKVDPALAEQLKALGTPELGGGPGGGVEMVNRDQAKAIFEKAYDQALKADPEGAAQMKEMFSAYERGDYAESIRPTPETMERMHGEMEKYFAEHGHEGNDYTREYAAREMDHFMERGGDFGERLGPAGTPEQGREAFERWAAEGGANPADVDRMRAEMEHGFEMAREFEAQAREFEVYREFERVMPEYERDTSAILDKNIETYGGGGGGGTSHTLVEGHNEPGHEEGHWDGNSDGIADHTHVLGTAPH